MAILNYTTKIESGKTVAELQQLLAKAGCQKVLVDYEAKEPVAVTFMVEVNNYPIYFTLPANVEGVRQALLKDPKVGMSYCTTDQARRVAWRIIKNWCEAQLAIIEAGQAQLAEVFLPYAITQNGKTLFQRLDVGDLPVLGRLS